MRRLNAKRDRLKKSSLAPFNFAEDLVEVPSDPEGNQRSLARYIWDIVLGPFDALTQAPLLLCRACITDPPNNDRAEKAPLCRLQKFENEKFLPVTSQR